MTRIHFIADNITVTSNVKPEMCITRNENEI